MLIDPGILSFYLLLFFHMIDDFVQIFERRTISLSSLKYFNIFFWLKNN